LKINKIKNRLSNNFINSLEKLAAGYLSPAEFEVFIGLLSAETGKHYFNEEGESNFYRILSSRMDKSLFLRDLIKYPNYIEILAAVSAYSNYLADILVINPEYFYLVSNPSALNAKLKLEEIGKIIKESAGNFSSIKGKINALKGIKRREILRIGLRDIILKKSVAEITAELSALAKALSASLFEICYAETLKKYKISKIGRKYALVGLGKLGGNELNYSSDIDLLLFYDKNSSYNSKEYFEILSETIQLFIEKASNPTENGFLYRVDFRLRPDGRNSPLCKALQDYLVYYESRGEDWERQMLIKADFICGDTQLYNSFIKYLTPFIYPAYFKSSPLEQVRRMKENIEKRVTGQENIKLSKGGIRDIEFSLQALQLINGKRYADLKTGNSLIAISKLRGNGLLSPSEAEIFEEAYIFYRKIEHFLQLRNDSQVHTIPSEGSRLEALSTFMGFKNVKDFRKTLDKYKDGVIKIYNSITSGNGQSDEDPFSKIKNLENADKAAKNITFLREGKGLFDRKTFDSKTIDAFSQIEPALMEYLAKSSDPDTVLQNFCHIIRPEAFPAIWYEEFRNNKFFNAFLKILEYSHKTVDLLINNKLCKELFITRRGFEPISPDDFNGVSPSILIFLLALQFTVGLVNHAEIFRVFKEYFDWLIRTGTEKQVKKFKGKYFIAALGSFGAGEMSFASDIDLIFVSSEKMDNPRIQLAFEGLLKKLQEDCSPFDIDCRLRPEGQNGPLVWDLKNYEKYLEKRAKVWEYQSLCKIRLVAGSYELYSEFQALVNNRLNDLNTGEIKKEISRMRKMLYPKSGAINDIFNIKKSRGGIADIEFLIQFFMLSKPDEYLKYSGNNFEFLSDKILSPNIKKAELETLRHNFAYLKNLELGLQNIYNTSQLNIVKENKGYHKLADFLNFDSQAEMFAKTEEVRKENHAIFNKYIEQV
jgi:glutamate-ammonia-ligase adenylyltransferase